MQVINQTITPPSISSSSEEATDSSLNLAVIFGVLLSNKSQITVGILLGVLVSVVVAFLQPVYFNAQVRIMPPSGTGGGAAQAAILGALGSGSVVGSSAAGMLGIKNPADMYIGLLKSRTIADSLIKQFKLMDIYEVETYHKARLDLANLTKIMAGKDGIISIDVEDQSPERAAQIANAYFTALQAMMQRMSTTEAGQRRLFFENQIKQIKKQLTDAEEGFKGMQQNTGVLQLDAQGKAAIESAAKMHAAISAKEVELASMSQYATPQNPDYQRRITELIALRSELAKLKLSQTGKLGVSNKDNDQAITTENNKKLSESGLEYTRRLRDLKYAETMFELMSKQLEFARLDEAREIATLQLIDEAVIPELKSRPKRAILVIIGTFLSGLLVLAFVLFRTRKQWLNPKPLSVVV